ncbi:cobalt-precorrin-6A reductase [Gluconobacter frateurii]|uniref:Precorrin 6x reductase n=1 Tax=Gluconobacter frateurii NRIC 0228 TaxID=1307946 RepID=A0ABQ0QEZ9_9PROT|nr:cobalt-precorrin-6A reductase [Gluconobacter frateurii]GBR16486.1 precorrin 6x reductase [Gluconobacter frateurii NRIC 0228]GLP90585.1 precorrin-6A reductase [Gluconobacter frateurii]
MRVLILGGTTQASQLAQQLGSHEGYETVFSLAGVTKNPVLPNTSVRIGGFGGVDGLRDFLRVQNIEAVVDATHPFAAQMSRHAAMACASSGVPVLRIDRPAWTEGAGDRWTHVSSIEDAAAALGDSPRTVFLTTGRKDLGPFQRASQHHYILRSIDAPEPSSLPRKVTLLLARPPFTVASEMALMKDHAVTVLVTKNAGAEATAAKLVAAKMLGLPVIMIDRPVLPPVKTVSTIESAIAWLCERRHAGTDRDV